MSESVVDAADVEETVTQVLTHFVQGGAQYCKAMCAVVVSQTSCKDRNHPILRGVIAPHQDFFFFAKIMIFLDF